jgi:hemoglobin-like flavoprotein
MQNGQMQRVVDTWNQLGTGGRKVSERFYQRLFEQNPGLQDPFKFGLSEPAEKLTHMLSFAVTNLMRPDTLLPAARQLGKMHAALGVRPEHYDAAAAPLLWALKQSLGAEWNPETETAWSDFYALATGALKEGARAME